MNKVLTSHNKDCHNVNPKPHGASSHVHKGGDVVLRAEHVVDQHNLHISGLKDGISLWQKHLLAQGLNAYNIKSRTWVILKFLKSYPQPNNRSIDEYLALYALAGRQKTTINAIISALKSFFGFLDYYALWGPDPTVDIVRPHVPKKERIVPPLSDIKALLSQPLSIEERLWLSLFIDCGLRLSELASIRLDHLDLENRWIIIWGKGDKERRVHVSPPVCSLIANYLPHLNKAGHKPTYLFPAIRKDSHRGYREITSFEKRLRNLCDRAGIPHITPHQLRHFFATYELKDGADIKAVSITLGHASIRTTLDIYYHVDEQAIKVDHDAHSPFNVLGQLEMPGLE